MSEIKINYCEKCGLSKEIHDEVCRIKEETILIANNLQKENEKLKEFVRDCSVSHVESRYKYRAQVLIREAE